MYYYKLPTLADVTCLCTCVESCYYSGTTTRTICQFQL